MDNIINEENQLEQGTINGHDYVDLGLSVKWATMNIGASAPGDYGRYFQWGELSSKSSTEENSSTYGINLGEISGVPAYDVARDKWGSNWRLPTKAELEELEKECIWNWTSIDGHYGYKVTGPNGKSIFLPATGWRFDDTILDQGNVGYYWSGSSYESDSYAYQLYFRGGYKDKVDHYDVYWGIRWYGLSVRPVLNEW